MQRRIFIQGLAASATLCCAAGAARAAGSSDFVVTELPRGAFAIQGAGANVMVYPAAEACLLVDCGSAEHTAGLARVIRDRAGGKPVRLVVNTHWHLNHTGGNEHWRRAGAQIVAHENTRLWMTTDIVSRWNGRSFPPRAREAWPTRTFYTTDRFDFGDETVECGYVMQAHTDGDIYVRFTKANVLVTGGVFTPGRYPVTDPATLGWIGGVTSGTEQLLKLCDEETRIVPGLGDVQRRPALEAQSKMLVTVRDRLYALLRQGRSADEMLAARPTAEFDAEWGDPAEFIRSAFVGMAAHVRQIPGIV